MGYSDSRYDNGMDDDERDRRPNGRERAADRASRRQRSNTNGTGSRGTSLKKSATERAIDAGLRFGGIGQSRADRENPDGFAGENFFRSPEEQIARNNSRPNRWGQKVGGFASGQLEQPLDLPQIEENSPEPFSDPNAGDPNAGVFSGEVVPTNNSFQRRPRIKAPVGEVRNIEDIINEQQAVLARSPWEKIRDSFQSVNDSVAQGFYDYVPGAQEWAQSDVFSSGNERALQDEFNSRTNDTGMSPVEIIQQGNERALDDEYNQGKFEGAPLGYMRDLTPDDVIQDMANMDKLRADPNPNNPQISIEDVLDMFGPKSSELYQGYYDAPEPQYAPGQLPYDPALAESMFEDLFSPQQQPVDLMQELYGKNQ